MTELIDKPQFSNFESQSNLDTNKPYPINKTIELNINSMEELCEACIKANTSEL